MRIVALDDIRNERGEPTIIGVIGSCRVQHSMQALVRNRRARLLNLLPMIYTHTPHEAAQHLRYSLGALPIPSAFQTYVLGEEKESRVSLEGIELARRIDVFVVEVSSIARISCGAFDFQVNYFVRNFVRGGGASHLDWWRAVTTGDARMIDATEAALASRTGVTPADEEILRATTLDMLDKPAFEAGMDALTSLHPARWLFVSHINLSQRESKADPRRDLSMQMLRDYAARRGAGFMDPTELVLAAGRENALGAGGRDLNHYNPAFEPTMGEAIAGEIARVMTAAPSSPGLSAPPRNGHLDEDDLAQLGRLPGSERAPAAELRRFARLHADAGRPAVADVFWREVLEIDQADTEAARSVVEYARAEGHDDVATIYLQLAEPADGGLARLEELWPALGNLEALAQGEVCGTRATALRNLWANARLFRRESAAGAALHRLSAAFRETVAGRQRAEDFLGAARIIAFMADAGMTPRTEAHNLRNQNLRKIRAVLNRANKAYQTERSEALAAQYVELDGTLPLAWWLIGGKAFREGRLDAARDAYGRCIELRPDYARFHFWSALVALRRRRYNEALPALRSTVRQADPEVDRRIARSAGRLLPLVERRLCRNAIAS